MDELDVRIEYTRRKLLETASEQGLSSNETIQLSEELDVLLNAYCDEQKALAEQENCSNVINHQKIVIGAGLER